MLNFAESKILFDTAQYISIIIFYVDGILF
jgi:hypothetical protein